MTDRLTSIFYSKPARYLPSHPIKALVTSRLEKYRPETEEWLRRHGVVYEQLIMLDLPSAAERRQAGVAWIAQGGYYRTSSARLVIERTASSQ